MERRNPRPSWMRVTTASRAAYLLPAHSPHRLSILRALPPARGAGTVSAADVRRRAQAWRADCVGNQAALHAPVATRGGLWGFQGTAAPYGSADPDY